VPCTSPISFAPPPTVQWWRGVSGLALQAGRTAQAGNRRFGILSALRTQTKAPYKTDLLWETPRALNRPGRARTGGGGGIRIEFAPTWGQEVLSARGLKRVGRHSE
jgi:hypothetical protein